MVYRSTRATDGVVFFTEDEVHDARKVQRHTLAGQMVGER